MPKSRNVIRQEKADKNLLQLAVRLDALVDPLCRVIDRSAQTILDLGCGQGYPIRLLRTFMHPTKVVGVDLFEDYIQEARAANLHDSYIISDVRRIDFPARSFEVVIASHVIEHLPKKDGPKFLRKLERMASKQVIIATPIGKMDHPAVDGNPLQLHRSFYFPADFEKLGYQVVKYGRRSWLGDNGCVHQIKSRRVRQLVYLLNIMISPLFYIFPSLADYILVAVKNLDDR